ncbi:hypothetical protein ACOSP7_013614 [Xanthoceras sorbifolium]
MTDFGSSSRSCPLSSKTQAPSQCRQPPSVGFKINVDAATNIFEGFFGVGVVIRNPAVGCIVFPAAFFYPSLFSVDVCEAKAILVDILCAGKKSLQPFCVESDYLGVVNLYFGLFVSRAEIDLIVQDISIFKLRTRETKS